MLGLSLISCLGGCVSLGRSRSATTNNAFVSYWPPSNENKQLRLAVKDLIDMKGEITTAGSQYIARTATPATKDAECLALARERGVQIVGKTNLTELAVTVSGKNRYFGTPKNLLDGKHKYIPGGSSSGSAVAVKSGMADVAFGTDTGGSIRVPAACCGIMGLKTTYGLVSTKVCFPSHPNISTRSVRWPRTCLTSCKGWTYCREASRVSIESGRRQIFARDITIGGSTLTGPIPRSTKLWTTLSLPDTSKW